MKEAVVGIAERRESLRARVTIQAAVERFACLDEVLPVFEAVRVGLLRDATVSLGAATANWSVCKRTTRALCLRTEANSSSEAP